MRQVYICKMPGWKKLGQLNTQWAVIKGAEQQHDHLQNTTSVKLVTLSILEMILVTGVDSALWYWKLCASQRQCLLQCSCLGLHYILQVFLLLCPPLATYHASTGKNVKKHYDGYCAHVQLQQNKKCQDANKRRVTDIHCGFCFQIFYPETTDVYDRKNMPKVVYCIHALR